MRERDEDAHPVGKESCPDCGSRDNLVRYSDGHAFCFTPGCERFEPGDGDHQHTHTHTPRRRMDLLTGEIEPIPNRGLTYETAKHFGYRVGTFDGRKAHLAPYFDDENRLDGQKVRFKRDGEKQFTWAGNAKVGSLFGQQLVRDSGKMIVITEGEIDAMSVAQAMNLRWPAVSVPNGAGNAHKDIARHLAWLEKFETVTLAFDNDDAGRAAVEKVLPLFSPGKVKVVQFPEGIKDANDLVRANRSAELVQLIWGAKSYRPDGIRTVSDLKARAMAHASWGLPWPWPELTRRTYGILRRYMYGWGAGVGSGKTTTFKQVMLTAMRPDLLEDHSDVLDHKGQPIPIPPPRKVGTILFEENPAKTLRSLAGMAIGKRVNKPDVDYSEADLEAAMDSLEPYLYAVDTFGAKDWDAVKNHILFLVLVEGIKDIFLDPLTALVANADDERRELDSLMADLSGMVEAHDFTLHYISHLTTPAGTPHEEGGRVMEKHFTGSRALARWTHAMYGLERDKQSDDPTLFRGLKDREHGDAVGPMLGLCFDEVTGRMVQCDLPSEGEKAGFQDESHNDI